jgi:hypothetical protein
VAGTTLPRTFDALADDRRQEPAELARPVPLEEQATGLPAMQVPEGE